MRIDREKKYICTRVENGRKGEGVARAESMGWIAPPEASAASLVSRYVTCKFVLRRDPSLFLFLFCMLASFHRAFPRSVLPLPPPVHGGRAILANALHDSCLVNGTKLKQRCVAFVCGNVYFDL